MYIKITNVTSVVRCTKDEFRCSVVPRANVRHIWFTLYQNFSTTVNGEKEGGKEKWNGRIRERERVSEMERERNREKNSWLHDSN